MPSGMILHAVWHSVNLLVGTVGRDETGYNTPALAVAAERGIIRVRDLAPFLSLPPGSVQ